MQETDDQESVLGGVMFQRLNDWLDLRREMKFLKEDRDWWRQQAIARDEHIEYHQRASKYYRERWQEALAAKPSPEESGSGFGK